MTAHARFCLAISLLLLLAACEPKDRRPGLWLAGEEVTGNVSDWRFSDADQEIFIETRTWYGIPHSVTTVVATTGDKLYVPSLYYATEDHWPDAKAWNSNVVADPQVRLKIGGKLYPRKAVLVEDEQEFASASQALARKYPFWSELIATPANERLEYVIVRMDPQDKN